MIDAAPPPLPVGVGLREFHVAVYRPAVRPGPVKLNLVNRGEDAHDLRISGPRGFAARTSAEVAPFGGRGVLSVTLRRPGSYRLVCTLPGHAVRGMRATLRVMPAPGR